MNIRGLKIKNYRSFGGDGISIENLEKINIFIGKNNTGKSNILKFLETIKGDQDWGIRVGINKTPLNKNVVFTEDDVFGLDLRNPIELTIEFDLPQNADFSPLEISQWYVTYQISVQADGHSSIAMVDSPIHHEPEDRIRGYAQKKLGTSGGSFDERKTQVVQSVNPSMLISLPKIQSLGEFRKLKEDENLRIRLHSIVHPSYKQPQYNQKKADLLSFVKDILGEDVEILIPNINQEIELKIGGRHHSLSAMGTGVHEVILLGMHLIMADPSLFCIDEPELHLHPTVQRSFLKFISKNTDHIYFISTHSNSFLDFEAGDKAIYRTSLEEGRTVLQRCRDMADTYEVLNDLGIRASELLQSNGIIWVEGPTDRVYIKKWLEFSEPSLQEGLHFTFQYYGGKLLNQYSIGEEAFKELLNMLFINRNAFIVIDSDMPKKFGTTDLRDTKQRILQEAHTNGVGVWVTAGREIENYLTNDLLGKLANKKINRNTFHKMESYCDVFDPAKKLEFAKRAIENMEIREFDSNMDLRERINELIEKIKSWNNI